MCEKTPKNRKNKLSDDLSVGLIALIRNGYKIIADIATNRQKSRVYAYLYENH